MILTFHASSQAFYPHKVMKCMLEFKARLFTCCPAVEFSLIILTLTNSSYSHIDAVVLFSYSPPASKFIVLCQGRETNEYCDFAKTTHINNLTGPSGKIAGGFKSSRTSKIDLGIFFIDTGKEKSWRFVTSSRFSIRDEKASVSGVLSQYGRLRQQWLRGATHQISLDKDELFTVIGREWTIMSQLKQ